MEYDSNLKKQWDNYSALTSAEEKGVEIGLEKGKLEGVELKNHEVVVNLLSADRFNDEEIAAFAGVYLSYVQKIRAELQQKKN